MRASEGLARFFRSAAVQWLCRLALAALFLYAAQAKIRQPAEFAGDIADYRLLPHSLVHPAALILPWVEALCGLFLLLGLWRQAAAGLIALLLAVFIAAIGFNLARGVIVDCGCFGAGGGPEPPLLVIGRDLLLLLPALLILFFDPKKTVPRG